MSPLGSPRSQIDVMTFPNCFDSINIVDSVWCQINNDIRVLLVDVKKQEKGSQMDVKVNLRVHSLLCLMK